MQLQGFLNWQAIHPDKDPVAQLFLRQGMSGVVNSLAPAPFCCSSRRFSSWKIVGSRGSRRGSDDDDDPQYEQIPSDDESSGSLASSRGTMILVDKHVFLHRLWVGLTGNFGRNAPLHRLVERFLPKASRKAISFQFDGDSNASRGDSSSGDDNAG